MERSAETFPGADWPPYGRGGAVAALERMSSASTRDWTRRKAIDALASERRACDVDVVRVGFGGDFTIRRNSEDFFEGPEQAAEAGRVDAGRSAPRNRRNRTLHLQENLLFSSLFRTPSLHLQRNLFSSPLLRRRRSSTCSGARRRARGRRRRARLVAPEGRSAGSRVTRLRPGAASGARRGAARRRRGGREQPLDVPRRSTSRFTRSPGCRRRASSRRTCAG